MKLLQILEVNGFNYECIEHSKVSLFNISVNVILYTVKHKKYTKIYQSQLENGRPDFNNFR